MTTGKDWGTTQCCLATPLVEFHRISILPMHQCSLHVHRRKANAFIVLSGELMIDTVKDDRTTDTTVLGPGEFTTVGPGEFHRFRTGPAGCECIEVYYLEQLAEDIERRGRGGPVEAE